MLFSSAVRVLELIQTTEIETLLDTILSVSKFMCVLYVSNICTYCVSEMYSGQYGQCEQIYCEFSFDY